MDTNYLNELINAGADAFSNLFRVTILDGKDSSVIIDSTRIENFNAPEKSVVTTALNYQNTFINIPLPANSSINKTSAFRFRVDENYTLYSYLKSLIPLKDYSEFSLDSFYNNNNITIEVAAYNSRNEAIYTWTFLKCRVVRIAEVTYEHNGSNALSINVDFTWDMLQENSTSHTMLRLL